MKQKQSRKWIGRGLLLGLGTFLFCCFGLVFAVLGSELRTSSLPGRCSAIWAIPLTILALVIFQIGSGICAQACMDCNTPICALTQLG
jgi:hypothetical protein